MRPNDLAIISARERDEVDFLVSHDWNAGVLDRARRIADPWYRCQALASCARRILRSQVASIVTEAIQAARMQPDPYRVSAVMAWPIAALVERCEIETLPALLEEALQTARRIQHPVSRLESLFLLWQAAFPFQHPAAEQVFDEFRSACEVADSWKAGDRFVTALVMLANRDPRRAYELAKSMADGKYKRRALRLLGSDVRLAPRQFF